MLIADDNKISQNLRTEMVFAPSGIAAVGVFLYIHGVSRRIQDLRGSLASYCILDTQHEGIHSGQCLHVTRLYTEYGARLFIPTRSPK